MILILDHWSCDNIDQESRLIGNPDIFVQIIAESLLLSVKKQLTLYISNSFGTNKKQWAFYENTLHRG